MPPEADEAAPATTPAEATAAVSPAAADEASPPVDEERWVGDPNRYVDVEVQLTKGEGDVVVGEFAEMIEKVQLGGADVEFSTAEIGVGLTNLHVKVPSAKDGIVKLKLTIPAGA